MGSKGRENIAALTVLEKLVGLPRNSYAVWPLPGLSRLVSNQSTPAKGL
jgi:hypothetical protein